MTSKLKAQLEAAIATFLDETNDDEGRPESLMPPLLADRMADAAEVVYDIGFDATKFAEEETKP